MDRSAYQPALAEGRCIVIHTIPTHVEPLLLESFLTSHDLIVELLEDIEIMRLPCYYVILANKDQAERAARELDRAKISKLRTAIRPASNISETTFAKAISKTVITRADLEDQDFTTHVYRFNDEGQIINEDPYLSLAYEEGRQIELPGLAWFPNRRMMHESVLRKLEGYNVENIYILIPETEEERDTEGCLAIVALATYAEAQEALKPGGLDPAKRATEAKVHEALGLMK